MWLEELAAQRQLGPALEHSAFGLRIGSNPHYVGSTTPKPRKEIRGILADPLTLTTRGRTAEAHHLDPEVRAAYMRKYAGTRIGRQELDGEILDDVEGALWTWENIDRGRVQPAQVPQMLKVAVAMDPSISVTEDSDECGIVAVGLGVDRCGYVLEDRSKKVAGTPAARRAWQLWLDQHAHVMVYESNQGKVWVGEILKRVWYEMQAEGILPAGAPPLREVKAILGKRLRAEPIAALWEMTPPRARMVGNFPDLEDQCTTWVPEEGKESPDRVDAMVHGLAHLMGNDVPAATATATGVSISGLTGMRRPRPMPTLARRRR